MALSSIDATVGGASSNSYITLAEANQYADDRAYNADWVSASDDDKTKALFSATERIDQFLFQGNKADQDNALQFPRYGIEDRDGWYVPGTEIPRDIKRAQFELALALLGKDYLKNTGLENMKNIKVEGITIGTVQPQDNDLLPEHVMRYLEPFLAPEHKSVYLSRG